MRARRWGLVLSAGMLLAVACGPPPREDVPDVEGRLAGTVVKGPVGDATVVIYAGEDGSWRRVVGAGNTDEAGSYDVGVDLARGDLMVSVSGGTFVESSTGRRVGLGARRLEGWALDFEIGEKRDGVHVNPVTTWIVALTRWRMAELGESLEFAEFQAASVLNGHLGGIDWRAISPRNLTAARDVPFDDRAIAGLVLASLSELVAEKAEAQEQGAEVNSGALVALIAEDLEADGVVHGVGFNDRPLSMHGADLTSETLRVDLARAMYRFVRSERNGSGLTYADVGDLILAIAGRSADIFPGEPDLLPVVELETPEAGEVFFGEVTLRGKAKAPVTEIAEVTLLVDGTEVQATVTPSGVHGVTVEATVYVSGLSGPVEIVLRAETLLDRRAEEAREIVVTDVPVGPMVVDLEGPADPTNVTSATFTFGCTKDECTFSCRLEAAAQGEVHAEAACASGVTYEDLADDDYVFTVVAADEDGESPPASWGWRVDTVLPVVEIVSGPPAETTDTTATFEFACVNKSGCVYECALDAVGEEDWDDCVSPVVYEGLAPGAYVFSVRAVDAVVGTGESVSHAWTVRYGWTAISAGGSHTCGLTSGGSAWCWGDNNGLIGDGTDDTEPRTLPSPVTQTKFWVHVSAGWSFNCALAADRSLWCWGYNHAGQLGTGDTEPRSTPVEIASGLDWVDISAAAHHACGVREDGTLWCWGAPSWDPEEMMPDPVLQPQQVGAGTGWERVSTGYHHTCALRHGGHLYCWGSNFAGQLGVSVEASATPLPVMPEWTWLEVSAGATHTCAVREDRSLWCWGSNGKGQLASEEVQESSAPLPVGAATDWVHVASGGEHTCAIREAEGVWCWGGNDAGQLGYAPEDGPSTQPVSVLQGNGWIGVTSREMHTCALRADGGAWCWGWNAIGQLGTGGTQEWAPPAPVPLP